MCVFHTAAPSILENRKAQTEILKEAVCRPLGVLKGPDRTSDGRVRSDLSSQMYTTGQYGSMPLRFELGPCSDDYRLRNLSRHAQRYSRNPHASGAVSYTHLTLPTKRIV